MFKLLLSSMKQLLVALFFVPDACLFINIVFMVEFAESEISLFICVELLIFLNDSLVRFLLYFQNHISIMFLEPLS